jgi:hypothetical protein
MDSLEYMEKPNHGPNSCLVICKQRAARSNPAVGSMARFLWGLKQRQETGHDLKKIWGVESFFLN